mmetsp:Transcript_55342/g.109897  ORF Transcript_55342/g.109897 Transcript_55342/m.109897 type:complete len:212 (-) Transcript_55342:6-641(-)
MAHTLFDPSAAELCQQCRADKLADRRWQRRSLGCTQSDPGSQKDTRSRQGRARSRLPMCLPLCLGRCPRDKGMVMMPLEGSNGQPDMRGTASSRCCPGTYRRRTGYIARSCLKYPVGSQRDSLCQAGNLHQQRRQYTEPPRRSHLWSMSTPRGMGPGWSSPQGNSCLARKWCIPSTPIEARTCHSRIGYTCRGWWWRRTIQGHKGSVYSYQ